jgi:hypothetical protein
MAKPIAPPNAASPLPSAKATEKSRVTSIPIACAMVRLSTAALRRAPKLVPSNTNHRPASSSIPTAMTTSR